MKSGTVVAIHGDGESTSSVCDCPDTMFIGLPDENSQAPDPQILRKEWKRRQFLPGTIAKRAGIALSEAEAFYRGEKIPKSTLLKLSQALFQEFTRTEGKAFSSFTNCHELLHLGWLRGECPQNILGEVKKD